MVQAEIEAARPRG